MRIKNFVEYDSLTTAEQAFLRSRINNTLKNLRYYHRDFFPTNESLILTRTGHNPSQTRSFSFCFGNGCDLLNEKEEETLDISNQTFSINYIGNQLDLANFMSGGILMGYNISLSFDENSQPRDLKIDVTSTHIITVDDYIASNNTLLMSSSICEF